MKEIFYKYISDLQKTICSRIEEVDGEAIFEEDIWEREEGGGGKTSVLENGLHIEKAGVNISSVHGKLHPEMQEKLKTNSSDFYACGLSLVIHPKNPFAPTTHANSRYFEMYDEDGNMSDQWFGGGLDLTPYYLFESDENISMRLVKMLVTSMEKNCTRNTKNGAMNIFIMPIEKKVEA